MGKLEEPLKIVDSNASFADNMYVLVTSNDPNEALQKTEDIFTHHVCGDPDATT